ncbi:zinc knuckle domain-containing protein [Cardiosporidium cionae]|uniref:Branchpoint-bridging protein n=1 Tax=Cardiosporidium cionae TaxID=476202 RepID=A0ABQ7J841_9APIC|nr:zinc knuckle domain-containing protein [Cardiosporidium cionae]|eukprot:KAF8820137.1 zinc knuckle domain-containing protein [Cardiosporidium cionae]
MSMDQLMALVPIEAANTVVEKGRKSRWEKTKERKGGTRWGPSEDKPYLPPPYVDLPPGLTPAQMDQFLREQRYDELSKKLAVGELEFGDPDIRPPSPPPIYDKNGSRINTKEVRVRSAMNSEYQRLVEYMVKHIEGFAPPSDFKPAKKIRRIEIPLEKYPEYNFMGLIIGPRGCNHKRLESESGAQISIRGRGTQKEGKRTDHQTDEEATMPMHVHVAADTEEAVEKAVSLIEPLLDPCHPMHEEFKKRGLEQLALVNGVSFGQLDQQRCAVCGAIGHLAYECPDSQQLQNFKKPEVRCALCGDMGHVTMDCKLAKQGGKNEMFPPGASIFGAPRVPPPPPSGPPHNTKGPQQNYYEKMKMDMEYNKMMNELTGDFRKGNDEDIAPSATPFTSGIVPIPMGTSTTPPPGMSPIMQSPLINTFGRGLLSTQNGVSPVPPPPDDRRNDGSWSDDNRMGCIGAGVRGRGIFSGNRAGIGHPDRGRGMRGARGGMMRGGFIRGRGIPFQYPEHGVAGPMFMPTFNVSPWGMPPPGMIPPFNGQYFLPPQMVAMSTENMYNVEANAPPLPSEPPSILGEIPADPNQSQAAQMAAWQMSMAGSGVDPNAMMAMQMMYMNPMAVMPMTEPMNTKQIRISTAAVDATHASSPTGDAMDLSS